MKIALIIYFIVNLLFLLAFRREVKEGQYQYYTKAVIIGTQVIVLFFGSFAIVWHIVSGIKKAIKWLRAKTTRQ